MYTPDRSASMIDESIGVSHPCSETTGKKLNHLEKKLPHFEFVHHKSHMFRPETEPRRPGCKTDS